MMNRRNPNMPSRTSNSPHQKYSMDESIGGLKRCPTCSSTVESSADESSAASSLQSPGTLIRSSRTYDIVFFLSFPHRAKEWDICKDDRDLVKLYKIKIYADSRQKDDDDESKVPNIRPLWEGLLPHQSSFAALDCDIYCLGGQKIRPATFAPYAYILGNSRPYVWLPLPFMKFPRLRPLPLVLDGNVYVLSGHEGSYSGVRVPTNPPDMEVYYPRDDRWDVLPDPPIRLERRFICAVLENPSRILVAPRTIPGKALLCIYDVGDGNWKLLDNPERKIHLMCPLGADGRALTVGNTLYWITQKQSLLAYLVELDMWLSGDLYSLPLSIFDYRDWLAPVLLHLKEEDQICMVKSSLRNLVHCVILDVSHNFMEQRLDISVVSVQKFKMDEGYISIEHCFLL